MTEAPHEEHPLLRRFQHVGLTPGTCARYAPQVRYTGVLQAALGADYHVIEDGANGRTSVYEDPRIPWRLGKDALPIALIANKPLDLLILHLGTNDLQFTDACGAAQGAESLIALTGMVQGYRESSKVFPNGVKILLVSPIRIDPVAANDPFAPLRGCDAQSARFAEFYRHTAQENGVFFFDAASVASPSKIDGVHMDPQAHRALGLALADAVRKILG